MEASGSVIALVTGAMFLCAVALMRKNGRIWAKPPKYLLEKSANAPSTSQALLDPYSLSHVLHGIIFYWLFHWMRPETNFLLSFGLECVWEVFENSSFIINRYRSATASLDYYGDSVLNTTGDLLSMVVGWVIARYAPAWTSIVVLAVIELAMLAAYRDNLALNILMLLYPVERVKKWQLGGVPMTG